VRIISGEFKGRNLETPKGNDIRPTTDRIKEAIFNLVSDYVGSAHVLDLFAGSGALGVEAISRGAEHVCFADFSAVSMDAVFKNVGKLTNLDKNRTSFIQKDYRAALKELSRKGLKFDLVFLDPPYAKELEKNALLLIEQFSLLNENGIIVLEMPRDKQRLVLPKSYAAVDKRDYGSSTIFIIKKATKCAVTGTFDPFTKGHLHLVEEALKQFDLVYIALLNNEEKEPKYPLKKRIEFVEKSIKPHKKRVKIDAFSGLAIDFCRPLGIEYIVRGVRNSNDLNYEQQMAAYNFENGGVQTVFVDAKNDISSTIVKEKLLKGESVEGLVEKAIIKDLK
jgi:16S rRNA (guanine(966)-N(2))-methyltransferase RsmD/pantetheine-phosphate adenylyltransferase